MIYLLVTFSVYEIQRPINDEWELNNFGTCNDAEEFELFGEIINKKNKIENID